MKERIVAAMKRIPATMATHAAAWKSRSGCDGGAADAGCGAGADGIDDSGVSVIHRMMP